MERARRWGQEGRVRRLRGEAAIHELNRQSGKILLGE
jgi:hypothetical protein